MIVHLQDLHAPTFMVPELIGSNLHEGDCCRGGGTGFETCVLGVSRVELVGPFSFEVDCVGQH